MSGFQSKTEAGGGSFRQPPLLPECRVFSREPGLRGVHVRASQGFGGLNS